MTRTILTRRVLLSSILVAVSSFMIAIGYAIAVYKIRNTPDFILVGLVSAFVGLILGGVFSNTLGHKNLIGWIHSFIGALLITFIGGAVVGGILLPGVGILAGLISALGIFLHLETFIIWMVLYLLVHLVLLQWEAANKDI